MVENANPPVQSTRHISVCICTFRRPDLLLALLRAVARQDTHGRFTYSLVVVDNDKDASARTAVDNFRAEGLLATVYAVEPEQNISLARNRALSMAEGEFVALIDDDEIPGSTWLATLLDAIDRYRADGVLGPVLARFSQPPPSWVSAGGFFDRPTHATGEVLDWMHTRTGNALLRRSLFPAGAMWFDPSFGRGGEDRDLFRRLMPLGHVFVWCNEAAVHEIVLPHRWKRSVLLKRALLRGKMALNTPDGHGLGIAKSIIAVPAYALALPFLLFAGQRYFMADLIKLCDHLGKLLACCGIDPVREKYVGG
ncbi:MAG: glycosyltransferase [Burkholderiales bacterium]